jgi:NADPH:quinone reductase-like Zn-dependent oxidoreductase
MKAVRLHAYGDVDKFSFEDAPDPVAGAGELLIKVVAAGLNPADLYVRQGFFEQFVHLEFPAILGFDAAGTIAAVGSGVSGFTVGERVIAKLPLNGKGSYAELTAAPLATVARLPANLGFEAGAALPLSGLTGRQSVDLVGAKSGDRVLVSGALGAAGRAAVHYLKQLGAQPVAGVRGDRLAEGKALAGEAIAIDQPPPAPAFDLALGLAGPVNAHAISLVRDAGRMASAVQIPQGANDGNRIHIDYMQTHDDPAMLRELANAVGRGGLTIPIAAKFPLAEIAGAHKTLAAGPHGKIVIVI